jgi:16S rRNA C1402 (ribose-2'-O) methylase RsmI
VREAAAHGVIIEPIPAPPPCSPRWSPRALPPYPFTFAGFPPPKSGKRKTFYRNLAQLAHVDRLRIPAPIAASLEDAKPSSATAKPRSAAS